MSLLMYAVTDAAPGEVETGGEDIRFVRDGSLVAVVGRDDRGDGGARPAEDRLWRYEHTIEQLMEHDALLPARFGSVFEDEAALCAMLRQRRDELTRSLDRVRGAVELGVRSSWSDPVGALAERRHITGTSYMLAQLDLQRRARAVARRLDELSALARSSRRRVLPHPKLPLIGAYLVDSERVRDFAERVAALDGALEEVALVCTGPWPPYSFVSGDFVGGEVA